jgi:rhodanese-related sulfurtransferase
MFEQIRISVERTIRRLEAFKDCLIRKTKGAGVEISIKETYILLQQKAPVVLLDIRDRQEIAREYIATATFIPEEFLEEQVETRLPDKDVSVVVYCTDGTRSSAAARILREKGYSHVFSMAKGIDGWKAAGYKVVRGFPSPLYRRGGQIAKGVP